MKHVLHVLGWSWLGVSTSGSLRHSWNAQSQLGTGRQGAPIISMGSSRGVSPPEGYVVFLHPLEDASGYCSPSWWSQSHRLGCSWQNWRSKRILPSSPPSMMINRSGRGWDKGVKEKAAWVGIPQWSLGRQKSRQDLELPHTGLCGEGGRQQRHVLVGLMTCFSTKT